MLMKYLYQRNNIKSFIITLSLTNISAAIVMLLLFSSFRQLAFSVARGDIGNVDDLFQFIALLIILGSTIGLFVLTLWIPFFIIGIFVCAVLALVFLVYLLLYPLELVLRRVAEYPTGPLLAVSTLIAVLGELTKLLISANPPYSQTVVFLSWRSKCKLSSDGLRWPRVPSPSRISCSHRHARDVETCLRRQL